MPRFAANLSMMYAEHAFLDRFAAAAADGFEAVEFLFPYDYPPAEIARRLRDNGLQQAHDLVAEVGAANASVQMDLYHCQIMEGDLAARLRRHVAGVGHVQIAGVPQRHEPDTGEVNYPYLFGLLDELGYEGFVGCEYRPRAGTSQGLGWLRPWLKEKRPMNRPEPT